MSDLFARMLRTPAPLVLAALLGCSFACTAPIDPLKPHLQEGEAALAEGAPERALSAYRAALALAPSDRRALVGLLRAEIERGDGESAVRALRVLDARTAELTSRTGKGSGAGSGSGSDYETYACAALTLATEERIAHGDPSGAVAAAREQARRGCAASGDQSLISAALVAAGDRERAAGRVGQAVHAYVAAVDADPTRADIFALAAELMLALGHTDDAVALLAVGLEHHPEDRRLRDLMVLGLSTR